MKDSTRDVRISRSLEGAGRDVRHGLRMLRRSPGYAAALIAVLTLGIGANGAVFGIVRAVLLQSLPYRDPARIVMVWTSPVQPPAPRDMLHPFAVHRTPACDEARSIHDQARDVLADSATYLSWQGNLEAQFDLTLRDRAERLRGMLVTPNFFDVLGATAAEGRVFTAADEATHEPLIVLSDSVWRRDFAADPSIVGRALTLMGGRPREPRAFTVVGVLPPAFRFTYPQDTEAWAIYPWSEIRKGSSIAGHWTVARLSPGTTLAQAQARVATIPTLSQSRHLPIENQEIFTLQPITDWVVGETRPSILLLGGVAVLLLLITCATVASAQFVRSTERRRELAVLEAMGADRGRLIRQLLTEGVVLSVTGAGLGTGIAVLLAPVLRALVPPTVPRGDQIAVNAWIPAFFAGAAGVTTILAALAPAWRGARIDVASTLKRVSTAVSADRATRRWHRGLVAAQTAIATSLLLAAALLLVSFWRLSRVPLGFDGDRVLTVEMRLLGPTYQAIPQPGTPPRYTPSPALVAFPERLLAGIRAIPGVLDAGLTSAVPFRGVDFTFVLNRAGSRKTVVGNARFVDAGYFSVLKVPLIRGRMFNDTDTATSQPVTVISESYARRMFGDENPIGQSIEAQTTRTVIGVVGDLRYRGLDQEPNPAIYFPRSQSPSELVCVVARTAPNAGNVGAAVERVVRQIDPDLPAMNLTTIDRIVSDSVADRRFYTTATSAFALLALALTMAALVVVVSRTVVERRRELAIRAALGATGPRLVGLVMRQGLPPVLAGAAVGLAAVLTASRVLQQFLFHVAPRAPLAYAGVAVVVVSVAAAAAFVPARRAADTAPASVLRAE